MNINIIEYNSRALFFLPIFKNCKYIPIIMAIYKSKLLPFHIKEIRNKYQTHLR